MTYHGQKPCDVQGGWGLLLVLRLESALAGYTQLMERSKRSSCTCVLHPLFRALPLASTNQVSLHICLDRQLLVQCRIRTPRRTEFGQGIWDPYIIASAHIELRHVVLRDEKMLPRSRSAFPLCLLVLVLNHGRRDWGPELGVVADGANRRKT